MKRSGLWIAPREENDPDSYVSTLWRLAKGSSRLIRPVGSTGEVVPDVMAESSMSDAALPEACFRGCLRRIRELR